MSELYLLTMPNDSKVVVKMNDPEITKAESMYLEMYCGSDFLPQLLYTDPTYRYIVYSFVEGETNYLRGNKKEHLQTLVKRLINHDQPITDPTGYGYLEEPYPSWRAFLIEWWSEASVVVAPHLDPSDEALVMELIENLYKEQNAFTPYLLHGDCGVHNFIFSEGKLSGVIDPTPLIGEPQYDLIYAFCSSPDDLTTDTLISAVDVMTICTSIDIQNIYKQVLISLYFRIATCIKFHPGDLSEYLKAWDYWKDIVLKG